MTTYDLAVVGAGPAGCATAITAAERGASVLLLERGRFPRHKVCGEFVSSESIDLLNGLLRPSDRNIVSQAPRLSLSRVFIDQTEIHAEIKPAAASITRFDMDAALWRSCLQLGIDARDSYTVRAISGEGPFAIITAHEEFRARAVVNASGRWSNLTNSWTPGRERWIGIKGHFAEANPSASVDLYFFGGGYCGVQPISSNGSAAVNACALVSASAATSMPQVSKLHPKLNERSRCWRPMMQPVTTSPLIFHAPEPVKRWIFQAGDAANFVDPFIGDGISLALRSGVLAAECLAPFFSGECDLKESLDVYRIAYKKRLGRVFRASSVLRKFLNWPGTLRRPVLSLLQYRPEFANRIVALTR